MTPLVSTDMLALSGVGLTYPDGTRALCGVDLHVPRGQFCALLGASGAGKSTLLGVLNGSARPTAGEIRVEGEPVSPGKPARGVATIHQGIDLVPRLSVLDNVLCGALREVPTWRSLLGAFGDERRRRACRLLHRVGLAEQHLYRRASELSGGQQQRVGIARAFMSAPLVVLADEPVASLDPRSSREILALLAQAAREHGATVVCSLHQVALAREYADRIIGMRTGRIVLDASTAELSAPLLDQLYIAAA